jgi:hypothetical protein
MSQDTPDTGNDLDVRPNGQVTVSPFQKFKAYCLDRADLEGPQIAEELSTAQMNAILESSNPDDVFNALELAGLRGLKELDDGTEITIRGFHFVRGTRDDFANRLGVFVVMDVQYWDGTEAVHDTGVERIIGALRAWEAMDAFPVSAIVKKRATSSGNEMITLRPVPPRSVPGNATTA